MGEKLFTFGLCRIYNTNELCIYLKSNFKWQGFISIFNKELIKIWSITISLLGTFDVFLIDPNC